MDGILRILGLLGGELVGWQTAGVALAAIGLNLHFGFTGLLNMGHAGFMLLGAYGFAIATINGLPVVVALLVAIGCAVLFALVLGIPTLKLRGDYLAIVTISAAEIIRLIGRSTLYSDLTGGSSGLRGNSFKDPFRELNFVFSQGEHTFFGLTFDHNRWWLQLVGWAAVALAALVVWLLIRSPWGRVLKGIREDEDAVRSLGKSVYSYKMQSLVLGGVLGSLGGVVIALGSSVQPDAMGRSLTFFVWTALLIGGAATIFGPIIGPIIFYVVYQLLRVTMREVLPLEAAQVEPLAGMLVGIALMLIVIFRPQGILGDKKELSLNVR